MAQDQSDDNLETIKNKLLDIMLQEEPDRVPYDIAINMTAKSIEGGTSFG